MNFLFEIGLEELPSRYVTTASQEFLDKFKNELINERIEFKSGKLYNSPRRLAILFEDLSEKQKDFYEKKIGPSIAVAYKENELTKAGLGFLKANNIEEKDIKIEKNEKGEYIYFERNIIGEKTKNILPKLVEKALKSIYFDKTMKWGRKEFRFARPIKWLLSILDDEILEFEFEGIKTSNITRGMRFFASQEIKIEKISEYEEKLFENYVIVDPTKRKNLILESIKNNCEVDGDKAIINNYLLEEVVNLVEFPFAIKGEFNKEYLNLPEDIITITMETHQRYFPVKDKKGNLTNKFIVIRNAPEFSDIVKKGNEKVIEPRLADAKFFFDEDLKISLETNVLKLKNVIFQKDMGSIFDKVERSQKIAKYLIDELNLNNEEEILRTIYLSKADLVSNVVSEKEFTKLQGFMGSIYAKNSNEKQEVSKGIFEHYLPRFQGDILPETITGAIASISDKIDTLVGAFSVGLIPTSSKDPYALRRATNGIIQVIFNSKLNINYIDMIDKAYSIFASDKKVLNEKAKENILDFFKQRIETILQGEYSKNLISYLINVENNMMNLKNKLEYLSNLEKGENFEVLINLIKRLKNISNNVNREVDMSIFILEEEKELHNLSNLLSGKFEDIEILLNKKDIINRFFDNVIINVEDEKIKENRLALVNNLVKKINNFIEI